MISPRSRPDYIDLLNPLLTGLGYFIAAVITLRMVDELNSIAIIWPASGLLLAVLLLQNNFPAYRHFKGEARAALIVFITSAPLLVCICRSDWMRL